jgi:hypothetical protein
MLKAKPVFAWLPELEKLVLLNLVLVKHPFRRFFFNVSVDEVRAIVVSLSIECLVDDLMNTTHVIEYPTINALDDWEVLIAVSCDRFLLDYVNKLNRRTHPKQQLKTFVPPTIQGGWAIGSSGSATTSTNHHRNNSPTMTALTKYHASGRDVVLGP